MWRCYAQSLPSEPIFQPGKSHMKQFVGSTIICVIKYILGGGQEEQLGTSKISPGTGQMLFLQEKQTDWHRYGHEWDLCGIVTVGKIKLRGMRKESKSTKGLEKQMGEIRFDAGGSQEPLSSGAKDYRKACCDGGLSQCTMQWLQGNRVRETPNIFLLTAAE